MNVYVDTGAWVAYFDRSDRFHRLVTSYLQAIVLQRVDRLVTSDYVLDETVSTDAKLNLYLFHGKISTGAECNRLGTRMYKNNCAQVLTPLSEGGGKSCGGE